MLRRLHTTFPRHFLIAAAAALFLACAVLPAPLHAQDLGRPSAYVSMQVGQGGFILSATGGRGEVTFRGRSYPFKVGGLGVGGLGVSKITAVGEVYRLRRLEDFPGAFFQARAGFTAIEGKGVQWLENSNGVILKLRSTSKGVALNLGADGLRIEMGPIRPHHGGKPKG